MEKKQYLHYKKNEPLILDVRDLQTSFFLERGELKGVDHVTFHIHRGETVGIVGEPAVVRA